MSAIYPAGSVQFQQEIPINGSNYLSLEAPGMIWLMEKGMPQLPAYRKSMIIPDRTAMNFRVVSSDYEEVHDLYPDQPAIAKIMKEELLESLFEADQPYQG